MAAIAAIQAWDAEATPLSHTFDPQDVARDGNTLTASWKELVAGVPEYALNRLSIKRQKLASGVTKVSIRLEIPVMESVSGQNAAGYTAAPAVAYVDAGEVTFFVHPRSVSTGRLRLRQLLGNILCGRTSTVTPFVTGQVPDAVDRLMMPT